MKWLLGAGRGGNHFRNAALLDPYMQLCRPSSTYRQHVVKTPAAYTQCWQSLQVPRPHPPPSPAQPWAGKWAPPSFSCWSWAAPCICKRSLSGFRCSVRPGSSVCRRSGRGSAFILDLFVAPAPDLSALGLHGRSCEWPVPARWWDADRPRTRGEELSPTPVRNIMVLIDTPPPWGFPNMWWVRYT